jgi:hypothetical protein
VEAPLDSWSYVPSPVTQDPFSVFYLGSNEKKSLQVMGFFCYPDHMENIGDFLSLPRLVSPLPHHRPLFFYPSLSEWGLTFSLDLNDFLALPSSPCATS